MRLAHLLFGQWRQHPGRTFLSIASVAIAVAALLATGLAQSSVRASYSALMSAVDSAPTLEIVPADGEWFSPTGVPDLSDRPAVKSVVPLAARATIARVKGQRFRALILGLPEVGPTTGDPLVITQGRVFREPDEAVLGADVAKSLDVQLGDRVIIITRRGPRSLTVTGFATTASLRELTPGSSLAVSLPALQQSFRLGDNISRVRIQFEPQREQQRLLTTIATRLPEHLTVQATDNHAGLVDNALRTTELAVRFAGALSVVMASFIILNTLRMNFTELRPQLAVVRVLGGTRRQIVGLHVFEGVCLGTAGTLMGLPLGTVAGHGLGSLTQRVLSADTPPPEISWTVFPAFLVLGPVIGALGSCSPALLARDVSPGEALRTREFRQDERFPMWSVMAAAVTWCLSVVLLWLVIRERIPAETALPSGLLMLTSFVVVIPAILGSLLRGWNRLVPQRFLLVTSLAAQQLLRRPTRTGLTCGALVVAISSALGLGTAVRNNIAEVREWQRRTSVGDVVTFDPTAGEESGAVERPELLPQLQSISGVERIEFQRFYAARVNGILAMCVVRDLPAADPLPWVLRDADEAQLRRAFSAGDIVISTNVAQKINAAVGDLVRLDLRGQTREARVAAVVNDYNLGGMSCFVDYEYSQERLDLGPPAVYLLHFHEDADVGETLLSIRSVAQPEGLHVETLVDARRQTAMIVDGIAGGLWTLFAIGFVVSGLGVANTLGMNILEQRREMGLLRILGMTRPQIVGVVMSEAMLLGVSGSLLGVLAGLTTAYIIFLCNETLLGQAIPFRVSPVLLVLSVSGCLACSLLAAWLPCRRTLRMNVLQAIAED